ncbi:cleavage and polyadenylation specificity factor subunit 3-I-like protein [Zopfochytrium polystomum]|nr:cleavage and polyadenylation specificity factor subunit 3-I-like protein [Zopfochytrium polystomum]
MASSSSSAGASAGGTGAAAATAASVAGSIIGSKRKRGGGGGSGIGGVAGRGGVFGGIGQEGDGARDSSDVMRITPLGAGQEVGRSCILLEYKNKVVMLDCGLHPAYSGLSALPFFDNIDPSTIDVLLLTHFHIDHAAALPYFMEKTTFRGRVFMTHPTKAIYKWLLSDYVKVSNLAVEDMLYDEKDVLRSHEKIEAVDFHQEVDVDGIKFTPYHAGHVLGAAMFLIEIAGVRVLYTGDYSREEDRHLMAAERPPGNVIPEVLIAESTYGVQHHRPRVEREAIFTTTVHDVVKRGGRCLIPVFALGRAQELLLILDEYWQAHPELHNVPIYYASSLAKKCMMVYQTFSNMMNARIRQQSKTSNPFQFKHISNLKSMSHFDDVGPCVMMASPGMLQNGQSRELLELWCPDRRNGVIIPGYVVEGTLAKQVLSEPDEIMSQSGSRLPLRLTVEYISFSAHVDFAQNSQFIEDVASPHLVLVHGDQNEMGRLKSALVSRERDHQLHIHTPKNCEAVELYFRGEKLVKTMGSLAAKTQKPNTRLEGILVSKDYTYRLIAPSDLQEFTDLVPARISQRLVLPNQAPLSLIRWHLDSIYGSSNEDEDDDSFVVFHTVTVTDLGKNRIVLEWEGNAVNDMIADSVVAVIMQAQASPASVKATKSTRSCSHEPRVKVKTEEPDTEADSAAAGVASSSVQPPDELDEGAAAAAAAESFEVVAAVLKKQFGDGAIEDARTWSGPGDTCIFAGQIRVDAELVSVVMDREKPLEVKCSSEEVRRRVLMVMSRLKKTLQPVGQTWEIVDEA